jgi:hypothetical protein
MTTGDSTNPTTKGRRLTKVYPGHRTEPLPQAAIDVAEGRVAHLEPLLFRQTPQEILVSAYVQGVVDTYDAMTRKEHVP